MINEDAYKMSFLDNLMGGARTEGSLMVNDIEDDREERELLKFHIKSNDYFITLANIIDLVAEDGFISERVEKESMKRIRDDLVYLHKNYRIVKK